MKEDKIEDKIEDNLLFSYETIINEIIKQIKIHKNYKNLIKICLNENQINLIILTLQSIEKLCSESDLEIINLVYSGTIKELYYLLESKNKTIQQSISYILYLITSIESCREYLFNNSTLPNNNNNNNCNNLDDSNTNNNNNNNNNQDNDKNDNNNNNLDNEKRNDIKLDQLQKYLLQVLEQGTSLAQEYSMGTLMMLCKFDRNEVIHFTYDDIILLTSFVSNSKINSKSNINTESTITCKEYITGILMYLSNKECYQEYILSSDFVNFMFYVLDHQHEDSSLTNIYLEHLLSIIFNLSLTSDNKTLLAEIGLIPILLNILINEKQSPPPNLYIKKPIVVEITAGILLSLSTKSSNKSRIVQDIKIIKLFLEYLEITYPLPIRTHIIGLMVNLSSLETIQRYIVTQSGLLVYINSLQTYSYHNIQVLLNTSNNKQNHQNNINHSNHSQSNHSDYSNHSDNESNLESKNTLVEHPNYNLLLQYLIRLLTALIRLLPIRFNRDTMVHLGLLPKLCSLLHSIFRSSVKLLITGIMLGLTEDKENIYAFLSHDSYAVVTLYTVLKDTKPIDTGITTLENTTGCLLNIISYDLSIRQLLLTYDIIPILINLLPIIPSDSNNINSNPVKHIVDVSEELSKDQKTNLIKSTPSSISGTQSSSTELIKHQTIITTSTDNRGGGYMTLAENSVELLRLLIITYDIRGQMIRCGILPLLLRLLEYGSILAQESSIGIILSFVYYEEFIEPVMSIPIIPSLLQILNSKCSNSTKLLIVETIYYISSNHKYLNTKLCKHDNLIIPLIMLLKYGTIQLKYMSLETLLTLSDSDGDEDGQNKYLIGSKFNLIQLLIGYMRGTIEINPQSNNNNNQDKKMEPLKKLTTHTIIDENEDGEEEYYIAKKEMTVDNMILEIKELSTLLLRSLADDPDCRDLMRKAHLTPQSILYTGKW